MKKHLKNLWNLIGYTIVALLAVIGLAIGLPLLIHSAYKDNYVEDYRYFRFVQALCDALQDLLYVE